MTTTHYIIGAAHQSSDGATSIRSRPVRGWSLAARGLVTGWSLGEAAPLVDLADGSAPCDWTQGVCALVVAV